MGLRKARCYRWDTPAFTRTSNNPVDSYITGVPGSKIVHFDVGDPNGDWDIRMDLIADEHIQIRHNALESARQTATRYLEKTLGKRGFHLKVRVYPHHILRENKMATGAGADRVQSGMRQSFGKPIGRAARTYKGQEVISLSLKRDKLDVGYEALRRAKIKLPASYKIKIVELKPIEAEEELELEAGAE